MNNSDFNFRMSADKVQNPETKWKCPHCGAEFDEYAPVNEGLLIEIAEAVQEFLEEEKLELPFIKKIELILYFYKKIRLKEL